MIELTLTQALAIYSGAVAVLAIGIWMYTELAVRRPQRSLGRQFLWRCTFCGCTYLDEQSRSLSPCPRCDSLNTREEGAATPAYGDTDGEKPAEDSPTEPARNTSRRKRRQRSRGPRRRGGGR